jgi:hypothetical protein
MGIVNVSIDWIFKKMPAVIHTVGLIVENCN